MIREWGEREHRVTVNAEGRFEYEGHTFPVERHRIANLMIERIDLIERLGVTGLEIVGVAGM